MTSNPQSLGVVSRPGDAALSPPTSVDPKTRPHRTPSRREAAQRGDLLYIGTDCPRHHGGERYVRTNDCKLCSQERAHKSKVHFRESLTENGGESEDRIGDGYGPALARSPLGVGVG